MKGATDAFLLALPALLSIVNPVGAALIFAQVTDELSHVERAGLASRVAVFSLLVMLGALLAGSYVLNFFGITLGALRVAGGLVVASRAWQLLNAPERVEQRKQAQAEQHRSEAADNAFYPLTMPFTTGPGTISVAIALSAERPAAGIGVVRFFAGACLAAAVTAALILVCYRYADLVVARLGRGARALSRLMAFLLLCIGAQIVITGIEEVVLPLLHR